VTVAAEPTSYQVSSSDDALTTLVAATEACADVDEQPALPLSEEVKNDSVEDVWELSAFKGTEEADDVDLECAASAEESADEVCGDAVCLVTRTYRSPKGTLCLAQLFCATLISLSPDNPVHRAVSTSLPPYTLCRWN
jgi:hypothetical protein